MARSFFDKRASALKGVERFGFMSGANERLRGFAVRHIGIVP